MGYMASIKRYNMGLEIESNLRTHQDDWKDYSGPAAFIRAFEKKQGFWVTYVDHMTEISEIVAMIIRADPKEVERFLLKYKDLQP